MKVGIISQARMTSSRLPGKVLLEAGGKPMLEYHVDRLKYAEAELYLAITDRTEDDPLERFANEHNLSYFRGDENDVLSRFYHLATREALDVIVRVTSDCPLIDGKLVHKGIDQYLQEADARVYLSICQKRTFPIGMDFEIFSYELLEEAQREAVHDHEREHVTPYLYQGRCECRSVHIQQESDHSAERITLDTEADFKLIKTLIEEHNAPSLNHSQISELCSSHPELLEMNATIEQKTVPKIG